jgi:hypothetical protein
MKTYFNYNSVIKSKEAAEAVSITRGVGPIIGFGRAEIDTNNGYITLYSLPASSDPMYNTMVGKHKRWNIGRAKDDSEKAQINFAGIAKDGTLFTRDDESIQINIEGTNSYNEVLVFSYHVPSTEPVDNRVRLMAFYSEADFSFYDLYKKSIDPYYPTPEGSRTIDFESNITSDSFGDLLNNVKKACSYYVENEETLSLIGIYGTGTNEATGEVDESFAIVPWDGEYPAMTPYTVGIQNLLIQSIRRIEKFLGTNDETIDTIYTLLDNLEASIKEDYEAKLEGVSAPTGAIILWPSDEDTPDGWVKYSGISAPTGLTYLIKVSQ